MLSPGGAELKITLRRLPWILAAVLAGYSLTSLLLLGMLNAWDAALPPWLENVCLILFVAPILILCRPWYPLLSRWGLMEGEWIRLPSLAGVALVIGTCVAALLLTGWLMNRGER